MFALQQRGLSAIDLLVDLESSMIALYLQVFRDRDHVIESQIGSMSHFAKNNRQTVSSSA